MFYLHSHVIQAQCHWAKNHRSLPFGSYTICQNPDYYFDTQVITLLYKYI